MTQTEFDFYRCFRCQRIVTAPEMHASLRANDGRPCPCGGKRFEPINPRWQDKIRSPRIWRFAARRAVDLGVRGLWAGFLRDDWPRMKAWVSR